MAMAGEGRSTIGGTSLTALAEVQRSGLEGHRGTLALDPLAEPLLHTAPVECVGVSTLPVCLGGRLRSRRCGTHNCTADGSRATASFPQHGFRAFGAGPGLHQYPPCVAERRSRPSPFAKVLPLQAGPIAVAVRHLRRTLFVQLHLCCSASFRHRDGHEPSDQSKVGLLDCPFAGHF